MKLYQWVILTVSVIIMSGCSAHHTALKSEVNVSRLHTEASTSLYYMFDADIPAESPKSGFYPLPENIEAFAARVGLIENAKNSIDVQYYLFGADKTGLTLAKLLLDAANRGVKIRIILDDMLQGDKDHALEALNNHPNIAVKLFNPTNFRKSLHYLEMAFHIDTLGRRMHNKMIVADNSAAIIGGRNIQDVYFAADVHNVFVDNDVLTVGPAVNDISNEFETYWSSKVCVPVEKVVGSRDSSTQSLHERLDAYVQSIAYSDFMNLVRQSKIGKLARSNSIPLTFGNAEVYFDLPTKVTTSEEDSGTHLSEHITPIVHSAQKSLFIVSPYFMPNKQMMQTLERLREHGVEITILTNSLATNDAIPVYSAYSKYQKPLLRLGVKLYELNPYAFHQLFKDADYRRGKIPRSALHAKSLVIDGETSIIGSANMDPRSSKLNTELVVVVQSKELARTELALFNRAIRPENAYELSLEPSPPKPVVTTAIPQDDERVVWTTEVDGQTVKYYDDDGGAGFWRRLASNLVYYFPIEGYL